MAYDGSLILYEKLEIAPYALIDLSVSYSCHQELHGLYSMAWRETSVERKLAHQAEVPLVREDIKQSYYIRIVNLTQQLDLPQSRHVDPLHMHQLSCVTHTTVHIEKVRTLYTEYQQRQKRRLAKCAPTSLALPRWIFLIATTCPVCTVFNPKLSNLLHFARLPSTLRMLTIHESQNMAGSRHLFVPSLDDDTKLTLPKLLSLLIVLHVRNSISHHGLNTSRQFNTSISLSDS